MPVIPFGAFEPDKSDLRGEHTQRADNVVPNGSGYGPAKSLNTVSAALPGTCRGEYKAIKSSDGSVVTFAGTSTGLYKLNNTDFTWIPVSKVIALTSISNGTPAVFTLNSHGRSNGDLLVLSTTGTLPTGLTVGTVYYVVNAATNTFNVSLTSGGSAVNTSGAGSGTHSMTNTYTAVPTDDQWSFVQYGDTVLATQINTVVQRFDLASSTAFANLAGSPPQARYIAIVLTFVVLSGLSSDPFAIIWSGNGIITTWTPGVTESDEQSFADGGIVRGVAGGQFGIICQAGALKRMVYVPGNALTFQFDRISEDHGILAPYSLVRGGDQFFFFGTQGFQKIGGTGYPIPIGKEKWDRTVLADLDTGSLRLFIGASDPRATRVYWARKSLAGQAGLFDKILVYDYALERGSELVVSGEYIASLTKPGLTLENLDSISGSIDALAFSLDDVSTTSLSALSAFSSGHKLGFFEGDNLEATIEIPEQGDETRRVMIDGIRPVSDAPTIYGSVSRRETLQATRTQTTETLVNGYGISHQRNITTRYARGRIRIPAGVTWTFATGIEPLVKAVGSR